ncbi:Pancreatic lipase-related protein 2 [Exaiptasia diaphana]|nr:Pancreatic lipase-related protein 2 [Exaiptasia diaphana]
MGKALITREDVNVILASWREGAREFYTTSVANTRLVGAQIAELIKFLNTNTHNTPASFHVIGFSLGAHIAGYVGRRLQRIKLSRISDILDGVNIVKCHHHRARHFYTDSIMSSTSFQSYPCSNWDQFTRGNCISCGTGNECPEMGYNAIKYQGKNNGDFYLYTNDDSPYAGKRHLKEGSTETFIAPLNADLGTLRSIDVWHFNKLAPVDGWRLEKVSIKFVGSNERYTACYGYWSVVFFVPNNEKLVKGDTSC